MVFDFQRYSLYYLHHLHANVIFFLRMVLQCPLFLLILDHFTHARPYNAVLHYYNDYLYQFRVHFRQAYLLPSEDHKCLQKLLPKFLQTTEHFCRSKPMGLCVLFRRLFPELKCVAIVAFPVLLSKLYFEFTIEGTESKEHAA